MESIDQQRLTRLRDAARSATESEAARLEIERSGRSAATGRGASWPLVARVAGALAVLAVGAVHLQQYDMLYSAIPTIGTLFVLNFAGATAIGLGLLAPLERVLGPR